jgi:hypothetical protein
MKAYESSSHDPHGTPTNYTSGSISSWQAIQAAAQIAKGASGTAPADFQKALGSSGPVDTGMGPAWDPPPPDGSNKSFPRVTNGTEFTWALKNGGYVLSAPKPLDVLQIIKS